MSEHELRSHPAAAIFPLMVGHEFHALVADIRVNDLREPITLHPDGSILDGRNRYRACIMAKVEPKFIQWDEQGSEQDFVISKNLARRHMSESQRAMVAAKLADMPQGARSDLGPIGTMSAAQAADALNVGERSVKRAKSVRKYGNEKLVKAVETGQMSVAAAEQKTRPSPERKSRRTSAEIRFDKFDHAVRTILHMISLLPQVDVPPLDDGQLSQVETDLRNAAKVLSKFIKAVQRAHDENQAS